jgi:hypothetical protein
MALLQLRLETLKNLDFGRPPAAFEQALGDAVRDCCDRPGDKRPRKVAQTAFEDLDPESGRIDRKSMD